MTNNPRSLTRRLLLSLVLLVAPAFAQQAIYFGQAFGVNPYSPSSAGGNSPSPVFIPYGWVRVCSVPATGSPCTLLASIWDLSGNPLTVTGGNFGQLQTNVVGQFNFQCNAQALEIQIVGPSNNTILQQYETSCPYSISLTTIPVSNLIPGANSQCLLTLVGIATWGNCSGTATTGVTLQAPNQASVFVNANSSSAQTLHTYTIAANVENGAGKTFHVKGDVRIPGVANLTEAVQYGMTVGGNIVQPIDFQPAGAVGDGWTLYIDLWCQTTTAGSSGVIHCNGFSSWLDFATGIGVSAPYVVGVNISPIDTTNAIVINETIQFSTASTSNSATSFSFPVYQEN
jgi:hypothetical protein